MITPAVFALAVICVGEAGWEPTPDCAAIAEVLTTRADRQGLTFEQMARRYSTGHFRLDGQRDWLAGLRPDGRRPRDWPKGLSWRLYRPQWLRMLDHARQVLAAPWARPGAAVGPSCAPDHWGNRGSDKRRAILAGWRPIDCGVSRNLFWSSR